MNDSEIGNPQSAIGNPMRGMYENLI
jgi:hypothetical protein